MLFFPYKINLRLHGVPFFTTLIVVVCFFVYAFEKYSSHKYKNEVASYCYYELTDNVEAIIKKTYGSNSSHACINLMMAMDFGDYEYVRENISAEGLADENYMIFEQELERFRAIVTSIAIKELWQDPSNPNLVNYFTSTITHADLLHLVFNLIFFVAFSVAVEQILGSVIYLVFFAMATIFTGIVYDVGAFGFESDMPTIGLSAFVTALMAFMAITYPGKKVDVMFLFFIILKVFRIPLILVVLFYIGSDLYGIAYLTEENNVDYLSHLSGFSAGFVFGLTYLTFNWLGKPLTKNAHNDDF